MQWNLALVVHDFEAVSMVEKPVFNIIHSISYVYGLKDMYVIVLCVDF